MDDGLRLRLNVIIALLILIVVGIIGPGLLEFLPNIATVVVIGTGFVAAVAAVVYLLIIGLTAAVNDQT